MSQLKIREMPQDERPREKLLARGADALSNAELIAILLRTGRRGVNVVDVARELLDKYVCGAEPLLGQGTETNQRDRSGEGIRTCGSV